MSAEKRKHLPWCRVHESWYTTRSHVDLGGVALNIGPRLMSLANASPERGVLLSAAGRPLTVEVLAREVRFTAKQTAPALVELVACGTLAVREDGAWWFPAFLKWQEDPSTERKRRGRERDIPEDAGVTFRVNVTPQFTPPSRTEDRDQRSEIREGDLRESLSQRPTPSPSPENAIINRWNSRVAGKGRCVAQMNITGVSRRWLAESKRPLAEWERIIDAVAESPMLRGEVKPWCADLDWLLVPENARKVLAGNYADKAPTRSAVTPSTGRDPKTREVNDYSHSKPPEPRAVPAEAKAQLERVLGKLDAPRRPPAAMRRSHDPPGEVLAQLALDDLGLFAPEKEPTT